MLNRMCISPACRKAEVTNCHTHPCTTSIARSWNKTWAASASAGANALSTASTRKITPLAISSCFTARVNGGKLKDMVPRGIAYSVLGCAGSTFRHGYDRQTAMAFSIQGAYSKDYIVLRHRHSGADHITDGLHMLPVGRGRIPPEHFVASRQSAGRSFPCQSGIVLQLFRQQAHIRRRRRRRCQRSQRGRIQARHVRGVVVIQELRQITVFDAILGANVLVLMVIILAKFRKSYRGITLLVKGKMIAAAQVAITPEHDEKLQSCGREVLSRN